jgi:inosose dehydratase
VTRVAYNPLPWMLRPDGFDPNGVPPLPELGALLRSVGLGAIQADIPPGMTAAEFGAGLRDAGLAPAPGYFQAPFEDAGALGDVLERARAAAAGQATLGLTEVVLACALNPVRDARPGHGVEADPDRLARIGDHIGRAAEVMVAEGVRPCLHPHAGTWIETAEEAETVLAAADPAQLGLCPDNGHQLWCGVDPVAFVARHTDRVGVLHIKDVHVDALTAARERGDDYRTVAFGHVITEPGRGDSDIHGVLAALSDGFAGWIIIEVDVFDLPTPEASVAAAGAWAREHLRAS